jgi:hypothetical protein
MTARLNLQPALTRWLLVCAIGLLGGWLALADPGNGAERELLAAAVAYFPQAPSLHARLAAKLIETQIDPTQDHEQTAALADRHVRQAIHLAPYQFEPYVLRAVVAEWQDDLAGAETALRQALQLAPHRLSVRWRLGNLQVRTGKLTEAAAVFQQVVRADEAYLPEALSLLWQAGEGQLPLLLTLAGEDPGRTLALANFLAQQEQYEAAAELYAGLMATPTAAGALNSSSQQRGELLTRLLKAGRIELAAKLWARLFAQEQPWGAGTIWNGGFERPQQLGLTQFDWNFSLNPRVRVGISADQAYQGQHALKLVYLGKETTRLEQEVQQLVLLEAGRSYRLDCLVKTAQLQAPDGPQVAVLLAADKTILAASPVIANGTQDWQPLRVEFTAPPGGLTPALITLRQTPKFSYTEPTHGTVWFDDFHLSAR